jgi:hypothetical protein
MPIDPSIALGIKPMQIDSPLNALAQITQLQGAQQQNQLLTLRMQQAQADQAEKDTLRGLISGLPATATDEQRVAALRGSGTQTGFAMADTLEKGLLERQKTKAGATKDTADALAKYVTTQGDIATRVMANPTPAFANLALDTMAAHAKINGLDPLLPQIEAERQAIAGMTTPEQIKQWAAGHALKAEQLLPKIQTNSTGGALTTQAIDPITAKPTVTGAIPMTQDPNSIASNARIAAEGAANRAQAARLHADTIAAENLRAGVTPGGGLDDNAERTAQAIASGQLPAPTGMALLNPKNQRILGRVMEINPQYDSTTVDAKKKAARDFTTGPLGNSMRSFQVAGQHLDQLGELADALNNGKLQLVNKIGNAYASQTGNPAPTNFEAAKDVVSKEVVKAIVAGGGGVAERAELSHLLDNAKSPAQLKGVIQQYRNLMAAQHDALLQQRRAAGLTDATLPNYTEPAGNGHAGTSGWSVIGVQPAGK